MKSSSNVAVVGLWHLGLVNSVGFAEKGYRTYAIDFNANLITQLKKRLPPIFEPQLKEKINVLLKSKILSFYSDEKNIVTSDFVVIAYDSPVDEQDKVSIIPVENACKKIATQLKPEVPVIITSQLPLGTCEKLEKIIQKRNPLWRSGIVYTPENLKLGEAVERFLHPDFIVLGSNNTQALVKARQLYSIFHTKVFTMDLRSAEMVKHALNTYLATTIAFGNEIARLSEKLGADAIKVTQALKADQRVGKAPISPGLGFSGGTIARDVIQLIQFSDEKKYKSELLNTIIHSNEKTFSDVLEKMEDSLGSIKNKSIGILGLTYKPGTSTLRRSPAIKLMNLLYKEKAVCYGYDPKADIHEFKQYKNIIHRVNNILELGKKSDIIILITEWPEFKNLPFSDLAHVMKKPILIDTKNFLDPDTLVKNGFTYIGFGR